MSTLSRPTAGTAPERGWTGLLVREVWASIAITAMWIAVSVTAVWGPDLLAYSSGGSDRAVIPSGIIVALFASLGTWAVAKYGFGDRPNDQG
jgi:hypothetical protein